MKRSSPKPPPVPALGPGTSPRASPAGDAIDGELQLQKLALDPDTRERVLADARRWALSLLARRRIPADDREDVVQEFLIHIYSARERASSWNRPAGYALTVLQHTIVDYYRRQKRSTWVEITEDHAAPMAEAPTELPSLDTLLCRLPAQYREVVRLRMAGNSHKAIADRLAISVRNSKVILHRARGRLQRDSVLQRLYRA